MAASANVNFGITLQLPNNRPILDKIGGNVQRDVKNVFVIFQIMY